MAIDSVVLNEETVGIRAVNWQDVVGKIKSGKKDYLEMMFSESMVNDWLPFDFLDQLAENNGDAYLKSKSAAASFEYGAWRARVEFYVRNGDKAVGIYSLLIDKDGIEEASYKGAHFAAQQAVWLLAKRALHAEMETARLNGTELSGLVRRDTWGSREINFIGSGEYLRKRELHHYFRN